MQTHKNLLTVGWREWVSLPELNITRIKTKIDTGARTSALHAFRLEYFTKNQRQKIRFSIHPYQNKKNIIIDCIADLKEMRIVTDSGGHREDRPVIETLFKIDTYSWPIEITLTKRDDMRFKMLLGRTAMKNILLINPSASYLLRKKKKPMKKTRPDTQNKFLRIAILSRRPRLYSTRRLMEAAKACGHTVRVIDPLRCYMSNRSQTPAIHYKGENLGEFDAVIPRIGASITFYGTAVLRQFEMMGVFTPNESIAITRSRDKLRAIQLLSRKGVGLPTTGFAHSPDQIDDLIQMVGGTPLVIKLLEGTQGVGVVLAETNKAARSVIEAFLNLKAHFVVQEYIKEAQGKDIRCFVVGGKVVASMQREAPLGDFRSNLHRGGEASLVKVTQEEKKMAIRATKIMGLHIAGVDILRSSRGPLVIEVNSSPGLKGIEAISHIDVASKIIHFIEENALLYPSKHRHAG